MATTKHASSYLPPPANGSILCELWIALQPKQLQDFTCCSVSAYSYLLIRAKCLNWTKMWNVHKLQNLWDGLWSYQDTQNKKQSSRKRMKSLLEKLVCTNWVVNRKQKPLLSGSIHWDSFETLFYCRWYWVRIVSYQIVIQICSWCCLGQLVGSSTLTNWVPGTSNLKWVDVYIVVAWTLCQDLEFSLKH
jgi:hypothetical protein